jgi:hypothetical protein
MKREENQTKKVVERHKHPNSSKTLSFSSNWSRSHFSPLKEQINQEKELLSSTILPTKPDGKYVNEVEMKH